MGPTRSRLDCVDLPRGRTSHSPALFDRLLDPLMLAVVQTAVGGPEVLRVAEVEEPELRRSCMLVRTTAIGVNFHDVEIRRRGETGVRQPNVLGTDIVGRIERMAPDVDDFQIGQQVVSIVRDGGYAELVRVHAAMSAEVPGHLDPALAAAIPVPGLTAYFLAKDLIDVHCENVVVHAAAGSVGCWIPSLVLDHGVRTIGIVSTRAKADIARQAGYHDVVVRDQHSDVARAVWEATGRRGADLVLDSVAGPNFTASFDMARANGTVVLFGRSAGAPDLSRLASAFLDARRNLTLTTFFLSRTLLTRMGELASGLQTLLALAGSGRLQLPVERLPLTEAASAHKLLESGATTGKLVLCP